MQKIANYQSEPICAFATKCLIRPHTIDYPVWKRISNALKGADWLKETHLAYCETVQYLQTVSGARRAILANLPDGADVHVSRCFDGLRNTDRAIAHAISVHREDLSFHCLPPVSRLDMPNMGAYRWVQREHGLKSVRFVIACHRRARQQRKLTKRLFRVLKSLQNEMNFLYELGTNPEVWDYIDTTRVDISQMGLLDWPRSLVMFEAHVGYVVRGAVSAALAAKQTQLKKSGTRPAEGAEP